MNKFKHMTFLCMQRLTNFPYIEEDFDALTNYELLCKVVEYLNKVIENENNQNDAINELAAAFNNLKSYVDEYFDNLDVQEEINNKLDEMAESGQLTDIIAQYLGLAGMITFNSVSEMKLAENLVNGSKCATLGYYTANDGGNAFYKIRNVTNEDVVNEMDIIALYDNSLVAELIIDDAVNIKQLGAKGDDTFDNTTILNYALTLLNVYIPNGIFKITDELTVPNYTNIYGNGNLSIIKVYSIDNIEKSVFKITSNVSHFIIKNFCVDMNDLQCRCFYITNAYDNCLIENIFCNNIVNAFLYCGNNTTSSQSLVINNCMVYGSATADNRAENMIYLQKCNEFNILNSKFMGRQDNILVHPIMKLENCYTYNVIGCSFAHSSQEAIYVTGSESRYGRFISNTYENISMLDGSNNNETVTKSDATLKFVGTSNDSIQLNTIIETRYYNTNSTISLTNCVNFYIVGNFNVSGGRRSIIISTEEKATQTSGNLHIDADGKYLITEGYGVYNSNSGNTWKIQENASATVDYGLDILKGSDKFTIDFTHNWFGTSKNGGKIRLKSPDGNTTKYLSINNDGEITLTNS